MASRLTFASNGCHLVVAIQVVLVGTVTYLHTFEEVIGNRGVASSSQEGGEPIEA